MIQLDVLASRSTMMTVHPEDGHELTDMTVYLKSLGINCYGNPKEVLINCANFPEVCAGLVSGGFDNIHIMIPLNVVFDMQSTIGYKLLIWADVNPLHIGDSVWLIEYRSNKDRREAVDWLPNDQVIRNPAYSYAIVVIDHDEDMITKLVISTNPATVKRLPRMQPITVETIPGIPAHMASKFILHEESVFSSWQYR